MLRKSTESKNAYNPYMFVDEVCDSGSIIEGGWRKEKPPETQFLPFNVNIVFSYDNRTCFCLLEVSGNFFLLFQR